MSWWSECSLSPHGRCWDGSLHPALTKRSSGHCGPGCCFTLYISVFFVCLFFSGQLFCFKIRVSLKRHNRTKTKTTTDHEPDIPGCVPWLYLPGAAGSTVWVEWTVLLFSDPSVSSPLSESAVWMTELAVVPTPAEVSQLSHVALRVPSRVSNWFVPPFP